MHIHLPSSIPYPKTIKCSILMFQDLRINGICLLGLLAPAAACFTSKQSTSLSFAAPPLVHELKLSRRVCLPVFHSFRTKRTKRPSTSPPTTSTTPPAPTLNVEENVITAVLGHTLAASDLYKLDACYRDKPDRSTLELDGTSLRVRSNATTCNYPSFSYVHQPLVIYFTILIHDIPDCKYFTAAAMLYIG
ncbi:hypothetical protein M407DRAFT_34465 [Tulasnella calospora MUT 4182]|uniref:Uncharacterized protein n=1 Tax=Tulasnella calospora MUT 4182 TaxID=1051891 RepID=A0A0C3PND0_9AGAM|nr:hypothetical protein M407DRAFT_34465 [Tulasnella calospora MUT 4182]